MNRQRGPNERKLLDHLTQHHMPDDEDRIRFARDIRAAAHLMLRHARQMEDGDIMALGAMLSEPEVARFVALAYTTKVLAHELVDSVRQLDAEAN